MTPVVGVQKEYLDAGIGEMKKRYKTIEGYFADGLGLGPETTGKLRGAFIEPG